MLGSFHLVRNDKQLLPRAERTENGLERTRGLLGRAGLERDQGLWIDPCRSIHTFFMRFPLDVIYLDRDGVIVKTVQGIGPWRLSGCLQASSVLEGPAGLIAASGLQVGDQLHWEPTP